MFTGRGGVNSIPNRYDTVRCHLKPWHTGGGGESGGDSVRENKYRGAKLWTPPSNVGRGTPHVHLPGRGSSKRGTTTNKDYDGQPGTSSTCQFGDALAQRWGACAASTPLLAPAPPHSHPSVCCQCALIRPRPHWLTTCVHMHTNLGWPPSPPPPPPLCVWVRGHASVLDPLGAQAGNQHNGPAKPRGSSRRQKGCAEVSPAVPPSSPLGYPGTVP